MRLRWRTQETQSSRDGSMPDTSIITRWLRDIGSTLTSGLNHRLARIERKIDNMPTPQEVHDLVAAGVQAVKDHLDQAGARVIAKVDALNAAIADLKAQLEAAGTPADFSDVEAQVAALQNEADNIAPSE